MATRTRYKSPSPVPSSVVKTLDPNTPNPEALSSSHFHAQYPQFSHRGPAVVAAVPPEEQYYDPRFSSGRYPGTRKSPVPELPILSFHNAVPEHCRSSAQPGEPVPVVLPPVGPVHSTSNSNGNSSKYSPPRAQQGYGDVADIPFGYSSQKQQYAHVGEKPRSLSIQSLISSPGLDAMAYSGEGQGPTRKRKGSDADDSVRGTRHGSLVPTSVSIEDPDVREVVEALGGLKGDFTPTSPPLPQHHQNLTAQPENEPLLDLITHRAHPLLSSAITTSLSAYGASKSYSASFRYAAESVENRVGLPVSNVVSAVGRRTGLEGVLRRGLQRSSPSPNDAAAPRADNSKKRKTRSDVEKSKDDAALKILVQQSQQVISTQNDREAQMALENQTWQKRLMLSTSGLGVALNDESMKNLKYCLQWLRFLNVHLSKLVTALRSVVEELDNHQQQAQQGVEGAAAVEGGEGEGTFGRLLPAGCENRRVQLTARVEGLKAEVVGTMKKVVEVVSNYTGSALPDNARDLIKRHIFSLPQRFAAASASTPPPQTSSQLVPSNNSDEDANSPRSSANRVLVLAKEGLDMMQQVSAVVEGTIIRAEEWCERLGKKKRGEDGFEEGREGQDVEDGPEKKRVSWKKKFEGLEERRRDADGDVVMDGNGRLKN